MSSVVPTAIAGPSVIAPAIETPTRVSYAWIPWHLNLDDPIDLNDKLGRDIHNKSVEPLSAPFDGSFKNMHLL